MRTLRSLALGVLAAVALAALPAAAEAKTVRLCKPGLEANPCAPRLDTTRFSPAGQQLAVAQIRRARHRRIDCFYVYARRR